MQDKIDCNNINEIRKQRESNNQRQKKNEMKAKPIEF